MATIPNLREFYAGRSILITGATGFLGKVLVEKILRSCPEVGTIYLLIRAKKGVDAKTRLRNLLSSKLFDEVGKTQPSFHEKVVAVDGDITYPGLGISEQDEQTILANVSIVFHSAATVRFDETLKLSVNMNMKGVQRMIALGKRIKNLDAFIHVSTAYCNCDREVIKEEVYPSPTDPQKLMDAIEWMNDDVLESLSPKLVHPRPNTYTFTKALAESIVAKEAKDLNVAIVRPSIIGATWKDPFPGWVDNFNGPTGLLAAIGKGALRKMYGNPSAKADVVPVDVCSNLMLAVAWYTAIQRPSSLQVYNCTTSSINPIYWYSIAHKPSTIFRETALEGVARLPHANFTGSLLLRNTNMYVNHYLPAWMMDLAVRATGGKPKFYRMQQKLWRAVEVLEFFTSHEWEWTCDNVQTLYKNMTEGDQQLFNFDVSQMDWDEYMQDYCVGIKKFALKEDMDKMPEAKKSIVRLQQRDTILKMVFAGALWGILSQRVPLVNTVNHVVYTWSLQQGTRVLDWTRHYKNAFIHKQGAWDVAGGLMALTSVSLICLLLQPLRL